MLRLIQSAEAAFLLSTHALLSNDLVYKDLGFLVADEEQRAEFQQRPCSSTGHHPRISMQQAMLLLGCTPHYHDKGSQKDDLLLLL
jgi:RecG-like helicase